MDYGFQNSSHLYPPPQSSLQPSLQPPQLHPPPLQPPPLQPPPQRQSQPPPLRHMLPPPQLQPQPQSQTQQDVAPHLYSSYYSSGNPDPYSYQIGRNEDPSSSAMVYTDGSVVHSADPYAMDTGYEGQGVSYGCYQPYQHVVPYPYTRTIGLDPCDQAKRKFKTRSNTLDLESKKLKVIQGGAAADAVRVCTLCNVVCNSDTVFAFHLAGEKHIFRALGKNSLIPLPNAHSNVKKINHAKKLHPQNIKKSVRKVVQTFVCEVCKLDCNSQEALNSHKMGKKHKGNLLKLQQSIAPKSSATTTDKNTSKATGVEAVKVEGSLVKMEGSSVKVEGSSVKVDLQVKKERVLKCGALKDAIMECKICDVICNSKTVYDSHISGKRHLALTKRQQEAQV